MIAQLVSFVNGAIGALPPSVYALRLLHIHPNRAQKAIFLHKVAIDRTQIILAQQIIEIAADVQLRRRDDLLQNASLVGNARAAAILGSNIGIKAIAKLNYNRFSFNGSWSNGFYRNYTPPRMKGTMDSL